MNAVLLTSACLQGHRVRYDGGSKPSAVLQQLEQLITLQTICPEVDAGMSVPRPPVQLVRLEGHGSNTEALRVKGRDDPALDVSEQLFAQAARYRQRITSDSNICGIVFKDKSPSCGLGSTPIFTDDGKQSHMGSGIIAGLLRDQFPTLLLLEQNTLHNEEDCQCLASACALVHRLRHGENRLLKLVLTLAGTIEEGNWAQARALCRTAPAIT